jgi:hypothetical protein
VIVYCELGGVSYEPNASEFHSRLAAQLEIKAADASKPCWKQTLGVANDACQRPRNDYCVSYRFSLPATLPPGSYELRLTERDLVGDQTATRSVDLTIVP